MKFSTVAAAAALTLTGVKADDAEFLTALVTDYIGNTRDYFGYIVTAEGYPSQLINFATAVPTYTDDSYTTLLDPSDVEVLRSYATNFPWYSSRLQAAAEDSTKTAAAESPAETTEAASSEQTTAAPESSAARSSEPASSAPVSSAARSSEPARSSAAASSAAVSATFDGAGANVIAPLGALVGAVAVALI